MKTDSNGKQGSRMCGNGTPGSARRRWKWVSISALLSLFIFLILVSTAVIIVAAALFLFSTGIVDVTTSLKPQMLILVPMLASIVLGTIISAVCVPYFLKPLHRLVKAMNQLAAGDFSVRLSLNHMNELVELSDSFNRMAKELGSLEVLREDFVNNFSHEFKTPIGSIKGFAEILKCDDLTKEERDEYLDIVIEESSRLSTLATNVLNLSKIEKQTILTETSRFNLGEQLRRCILLMEQKISQKKQELTVNVSDVCVTGNPELLSQVWMNLLDNAVKFTGEGGKIEVSMIKVPEEDKRQSGSGVGEEVIVTIKDNGCGISEEAGKHIFDKFYQGDVSHATKGNGLGLTIAATIIRLHGGEISCSSHLGEGAEFTVKIPIKK